MNPYLASVAAFLGVCALGFLVLLYLTDRADRNRADDLLPTDDCTCRPIPYFLSEAEVVRLRAVAAAQAAEIHRSVS